MKASKFLLLLPVVFLATILAPAHAHCPLCTGAAVGGVALARVFGVDDSIVGIFMGAFIVSTALWASKLAKKKISFPLQDTAFVVSSFLFTAVPFYYASVITNFEMVKSMPEHHAVFGLGVFGIDKILFGMILGTLGVWLALRISNTIKETRGKGLLPFQGVAFVIIASAVMSAVVWGLITWI